MASCTTQGRAPRRGVGPRPKTQPGSGGLGSAHPAPGVGCASAGKAAEGRGIPQPRTPGRGLGMVKALAIEGGRDPSGGAPGGNACGHRWAAALGGPQTSSSVFVGWRRANPTTGMRASVSFMAKGGGPIAGHCAGRLKKAPPGGSRGSAKLNILPTLRAEVQMGIQQKMFFLAHFIPGIIPKNAKKGGFFAGPFQYTPVLKREANGTNGQVQGGMTGSALGMGWSFRVRKRSGTRLRAACRGQPAAEREARRLSI